MDKILISCFESEVLMEKGSKANFDFQMIIFSYLKVIRFILNYKCRTYTSVPTSPSDKNPLTNVPYELSVKSQIIF